MIFAWDHVFDFGSLSVILIDIRTVEPGILGSISQLETRREQILCIRPPVTRSCLVFQNKYGTIPTLASSLLQALERRVPGTLWCHLIRFSVLRGRGRIAWNQWQERVCREASDRGNSILRRREKGHYIVRCLIKRTRVVRANVISAMSIMKSRSCQEEQHS